MIRRSSRLALIALGALAPLVACADTRTTTTQSTTGPDRLPPPAAPAPAGQPRPASPAPARPAFVDTVWIVTESPQVAVGDVRVFLSEGTLVMASAHSKPAFGTWRYAGGQLTITEDGITYPVDVLESTPHTLRIRIRGPGEPVLIRFRAAAPQPPA